jgi:hypothetical protein
MIEMGQLAKIRRMYHRDKLSIHAISKFMGLSRNIARAPASLMPTNAR